jgi:hypothetical protein
MRPDNLMRARREIGIKVPARLEKVALAYQTQGMMRWVRAI